MKSISKGTSYTCAILSALHLASVCHPSGVTFGSDLETRANRMRGGGGGRILVHRAVNQCILPLELLLILLAPTTPLNSYTTHSYLSPKNLPSPPRQQPAQPLPPPLNPPPHPIPGPSLPPAYRFGHRSPVLPRHPNPHVRAVHFENVDGDSGAREAEELLESSGQMGPGGQSVDG